MKVLADGEVIGEITTNHSMTVEEAIDLLNCETVQDNEGSHYRTQAGVDFWYEDVELKY